MTAEGVFHDAHEVYYIAPGGQKSWIGTFPSKGLAEWYVRAQIGEDRFAQRTPEMYEVVPV